MGCLKFCPKLSLVLISASTLEPPVCNRIFLCTLDPQSSINMIFGSLRFFNKLKVDSDADQLDLSLTHQIVNGIELTN